MPDEAYIVSGASLSATADAIRAKGGTSASIEYESNGFASAIAALPSGGGGGGSYQAKTGINPTTSSQTITPDSGYDALSSVQINAMPSGTAGTPTATKGTVSNHSISVTPSVTNTTGYITGSTINGTAVSVSASELVSGSETKNANGTYDVTNLAELVVNVPSGGSAPDPDKPVKFIDYDGMLLYSYTAQELQALTALPANPSHTGLTAQGWNYTLAQAKTQVTAMGEAIIGQNYVTDDGKTRIYCHFQEGRLAPYLGICPKGTVTVDWGDGSATDTLTGTSLTTVKTVQHTYASAGDYMITLTAASGTTFAFSGSSTYYSYILRKGTGSTQSKSQSYVYRNTIQKIELGSGANIESYAFYGCYSLSTISIPSGVTSIGSSSFYYCYSLAFIVIPSGVTSISSSSFYGCYGLSNVSIPSVVTSIGGNAFYGCYGLASIIIPSGVTSISSGSFYGCFNLSTASISPGITSIGDNAFYTCYSLASIIIPSGVTSIGSGPFYGCYSLTIIIIHSGVTSIGATAFSNCYGVKEYHLKRTTPPTLSNTNAFNSIQSDCIIYVPKSENQTVLNAYKTAQNWSNFASYMQEEPS